MGGRTNRRTQMAAVNLTIHQLLAAEEETPPNLLSLNGTSHRKTSGATIHASEIH